MNFCCKVNEAWNFDELEVILLHDDQNHLFKELIKEIEEHLCLYFFTTKDQENFIKLVELDKEYLLFKSKSVVDKIIIIEFNNEAAYLKGY